MRRARRAQNRDAREPARCGARWVAPRAQRREAAWAARGARARARRGRPGDGGTHRHWERARPSPPARCSAQSTTEQTPRAAEATRPSAAASSEAAQALADESRPPRPQCLLRRSQTRTPRLRRRRREESAAGVFLRRYARMYRRRSFAVACVSPVLRASLRAPPAAMDGKAAEGEKQRVKKKRPARAESKEKIPPTAIDAAPAAKPAPVAEEGPVRYEGCGPCKRAVPDVPLSDAGRTSRDLLFLVFFVAWSIGDLVLAIVGFKTGSPQTLIYGLDFDGGVCGRNNPVRTRMRSKTSRIAARARQHARVRTAHALTGTRAAAVLPSDHGMAAARLPRTRRRARRASAGPSCPLRSRGRSIAHRARFGNASHIARYLGCRAAAAAPKPGRTDAAC